MDLRATHCGVVQDLARSAWDWWTTPWAPALPLYALTPTPTPVWWGVAVVSDTEHRGDGRLTAGARADSQHVCEHVRRPPAVLCQPLGVSRCDAAHWFHSSGSRPPEVRNTSGRRTHAACGRTNPSLFTDSAQRAAEDIREVVESMGGNIVQSEGGYTYATFGASACSCAFLPRWGWGCSRTTRVLVRLPSR